MADSTKAEKKAMIAEALKRFRYASESSAAQRKAILEAKNFRAGNQWPDEVKVQRQGGAAIQGVAAQPQRPCLTIDRVSGPTRQVSNSVKQADFAMEVIPNGDGADVETADFLKSWMRRIQNESRADDPVGWAADGAAEGGLGWFRILSVYTDDKGFDQDLKLERIANSLTVYPDPAAVKPTRSDMRYLFLTQDMPRDEFKRIWPKAYEPTTDEFRGDGDGESWCSEESIRVAEYWYVDYDEVNVLELVDGTTIIDPKPMPEADQIKRKRCVYKPKVKWSKITCCEELESTDWVGSKIPFVPILGEEFNVDGKTVLRGVIGPAMDAQRMLNYSYSGAIEAVALAPKSPFIVAEGQVENYKTIWQNANTFNYSSLPYTPVSLDGHAVPPPQRNTAEAPIGAMVQMMATSEEAIKATTGIYDPSMGASNPSDRSGKAISALQDRAEFGISNYLDNTRNALIYAASLMLEMAPYILDRPGRIVPIHGIDDQPQMAMIGQAFQKAPGGQAEPVMAPNPQNPQSPPQPIFDKALAKLKGASFYDISAGTYGVTVNVGRASTTRKREGSAALGELIRYLPPEISAAVTPSYIESLEFPGAKDIAAMAKKALPPQFQDSGDGMANLPPAIQQKLAEIPQMQQAIQQAQQIIQTKQVEQDAMLKKAQMDNDTKTHIVALQEQTKLVIEQAKLNQKEAQAMLEAESTRIKAYLDEKVGVFEHLQGQAHEVALASHEHAQRLVEQAARHDHERAMAEIQQPVVDEESTNVE